MSAAKEMPNFQDNVDITSRLSNKRLPQTATAPASDNVPVGVRFPYKMRRNEGEP